MKTVPRTHRPTPPRRAERAGAFTLAEVLVVIGVIAVLLALLLPAVSTARHKAAIVVCASNMRQVHQATLLFAQDNNGRLPMPTWAEENAGNTSAAYQRAACWLNVDNGPGGGLISFETGGLWKYFGGRADVSSRSAVMNCPSDQAERTQRAGQRNVRNFSYSYNANIRTGGGVNTGRSILLLAVLHPADRIMIYEELGPNDAWCSSPHTNPDDLPTGRHGSVRARNAGRANGPNVVFQLPAFFNQGLGNQCFFDGHVELLSPGFILQGKGRNIYHCTWGPLTSEPVPPPDAPPSAG